MGCDIHLFIETKTPEGTWKTTTEPVIEYAGTEDEYTSLPQEFDGRNYGLFAILAGVRNGRGFAGVDIGDPTEPIAEPRGLPDDASDTYTAEVERWGVDGHSHSHFTLSELLAHDWNGQQTVHRMWVRRRKDAPPLNAYLLSQGLDDPDKFAARIKKILESPYGGQDVAFGSWFIEMCGSSGEGQGPSGWRTVQWRESHLKTAGDAWSRFLLGLCMRAERDGLSSDDMRVVFFFDN